MDGKIKRAIGVAAGAAMLLLAGAADAQTDQPPARMTARQWQADLARGDALNKRYHLGTYSLAARAGPRPSGMTTQQWQADLLRGDALNRRYGIGTYAGTLDASDASSPVEARAVSAASEGFDWAAAAIGAGAAIGVGLLASVMRIALRESRRSQMTAHT
jgi:hypothetical protein